MTKQVLMFEKEKIKGILPAVTFERTADVLKVAASFIAEGLNIMEVALRTPVALEAITLLRKHFENELSIGAGTVLKTQQLNDAINAGAMFGLAPGLNRNIIMEANQKQFFFIPGVMTPSDIEAAIELDVSLVKVFPAAQIGGVQFLKAMEGPYAHTGIKYIPMGGIGIDNMDEYLSMKQVAAVGGSWLASKELIGQQNYPGIRDRVKEAVAVVRKHY